jgi:hypothetical protein
VWLEWINEGTGKGDRKEDMSLVRFEPFKGIRGFSCPSN